MCLMSFLAPSIEQLQADLVHGDEHGKKMYDIFFHDELNPFFVCQRELSKLLGAGMDDVWAPVFASFRLSMTTAEIFRRIRSIGLQLGAQTFWRFLKYQTFPYRWALWAHPRATLAQAEDVLAGFYRMHSCCRDSEFSQKVFNMYPTPKRIAGVWARGGRRRRRSMKTRRREDGEEQGEEEEETGLLTLASSGRRSRHGCDLIVSLTCRVRDCSRR